MTVRTLAGRIVTAFNTGREAKFYGTSDLLTTGTEYDFTPSGLLSWLGTQVMTLVTPIIQPAASATPANNGDLVIEKTANTTLTFKLKGSDGTVRSGTITLS